MKISKIKDLSRIIHEYYPDISAINSLSKNTDMNIIKSCILINLLFFSILSFAQDSSKLMLKRTDYKDVSGNNTVSVTSYSKGDNHYVYVGGYGNVDVFNLDKNGKLTAISNHELYMKKGPARGMVADNINGTDFLFVANKFGDAIEVFKILNNGSIERVFLIEDTDETYLGTAITLQVIHMERSSYLFVGGLKETPGLSCFKINGDGKLTHVQSVEDDDEIHTDGIIGMFSHKIDGKTFLYTGGFQDNGVSSFRVNENGKFKNVNNISDNDTDRYLTGAYPVTGVRLGDNYYVIVGHRHHKYYERNGFIKKTDFVYHGDAVSVFKINNKGELIPHFTLKDDEKTKLAGQTRIEIVSTDGQEAILAVGTRDDASIQLCKLNVEGVLSPISYLETGFPIYYGLRGHTIGENQFLIAGSNSFEVKKAVAYKIYPEEASIKDKVLKHVVNFKFKADVSQSEIDEAVTNFENLKNEIPEIANIQSGVSNNKEGLKKGFNQSFTLTFKNVHDREVYVFHKAHLAVERKLSPLLDDVFIDDYWTDN